MKTTPNTKPTYKQIPIKSIILPKLAMRGSIDTSSVIELAENIRANGLLHPLTVTPNGKQYLLIAGHRRLYALRRLRAIEAPCFVRQANAEMVETLKCAENYSRQDLPPIAEARYLKQVKDTFTLTDAALAKLVGRSQSYVSEHLAANDYDPALQSAIASGKMTFSVARELHRIDNAEVRRTYTRYAQEQGISDETARAWREDYQAREARVAGGPAGAIPAGPPRDIPLPTAVCESCQASVPFGDTQLIRVCKGCLEHK